MDLEDLLDENKILVKALLDNIDNATKVINENVKAIVSSMRSTPSNKNKEAGEGEVEAGILSDETFDSKGFDTTKVDAGGWDEANDLYGG